MSDRFADPVVAEIHAARAAMLESAGGDIKILMEQVADRQQRSGRRVVREPLRRRTEPVAAPDLCRNAIREQSQGPSDRR
jgi:hypothetical protein